MNKKKTKKSMKRKEMLVSIFIIVVVLAFCLIKIIPTLKNLKVCTEFMEINANSSLDTLNPNLQNGQTLCCDTHKGFGFKSEYCEDMNYVKEYMNKGKVGK